MSSSLKKQSIKERLRARWRGFRSRVRNWYDPIANVNSYSQEGEDIILSRILGDEACNTVYVDVGCNHPLRFSNTAMFYQKGGSGVVIDPNPDFEALFKSHRPRDLFVNCGVGLEAGSLTYYRFDEPALNTFCSTRRDELLQKGRYRLIKETTVAVLPLARVLEEVWPTGKNIDLLSVDVEGMDEEVILSHNFEKYPCRFILVEGNAEDLHHALELALTRMIQAKGFRCIAKMYRSILFKNTRT